MQIRPSQRSENSSRATKFPLENARFFGLKREKAVRPSRNKNERGILDPDKDASFDDFCARWWPGDDCSNF